MKENLFALAISLGSLAGIGFCAWVLMVVCDHAIKRRERRQADLYSCRYCGIPFSMTQDEFWAHQRTVHPFTRNGVPVR